MPLEITREAVPTKHKTWRGIVRWHLDQPPTDDQTDALHGALPGYTAAEHDASHGTLTVRMTVEAGTARAAAEETLRAARAAHTAAFGTPGDPFDVRALTDLAWLTELERPSRRDIIGLHEAAQILGVTPQRANKIADTHDAFPPPVATPRAGRMYTKASIEAFAASDWRKKPGPKPATPAPAPQE